MSEDDNKIMITNRVFGTETVSGPPNPSVSVSAPPTIPTSPSATDQPLKRKRGRPKGSTSKKPAEDHPPDGSESKLKRPVGRPRKDGLPAGSVPKRTPVKRQKVSGDSNHEPTHQFGWGMSYVPPPTQDSKYVLDEWYQLAHSRPPHDLIASLLATFAAPNPTSAMGPTLEEAFKIHLQSLAPTPTIESTPTGSPSTHNIPSLYSILKTFWLPSSPTYFTMAASASNTRMPMEYRFLYWDPQPLVFNGIQCPFCPSFLVNNGRILSGPIKIYDIGNPFFIIGCEYVCTSPQCMGASSSSPSEGRKFGSTDASIMNSLPKGLKDEFPAKLLYTDSDAGSGPNVWNWNAMGVSTTLWNLVIGALGIGMRKEAIVHLVRSMQHGPPEIKYELKEEEKSASVDDEHKKEDNTPDTDTLQNPSPSFAQNRPQNQQPSSSTSTNPGPSSQPSSAQPFHSSHTSHPPQHHPASLQPFQPPPSSTVPRSHPQQPQQQQQQQQILRQSSAFTHYPYTQYPYYPDQQQQQQPRPTSATTTTTTATSCKGTNAGVGANASVRGTGPSK